MAGWPGLERPDFSHPELMRRMAGVENARG
jgi:hypothetical protein